MREKSELITLRIPRSLYSVIIAISKKNSMYFSEILKIAIKFGLSSIESKNEIVQKIKTYQKEDAFQDGDLEIKIMMKEAYAFCNFKKLVNQLAANSEISRIKKIQVIQKLFNRIEKTESKDSETYCEAQKWLISNYPQLIFKSKESDSKVSEKADIITE